jgi:hypothetical protein
LEDAVSKPPIPRVPSDDCLVEVDGVHLRPHVGEWVEVRPGQSMDFLRADLALQRVADQFRSAREAEDPQHAPSGEDLEAAYDRICAALAGQIYRWTWTNDLGEPIVPWNIDRDGPPCADVHGNVAAIRSLDTDEIAYLRRICRDPYGALRSQAAALAGDPDQGRHGARRPRRKRAK